MCTGVPGALLRCIFLNGDENKGGGKKRGKGKERQRGGRKRRRNSGESWGSGGIWDKVQVLWGRLGIGLGLGHRRPVKHDLAQGYDAA